MDQRGISKLSGVLCILALLASAALGATRTWTDAGGDQLWSNAGNWLGGIPGSGDIANFSTNATGTNIVSADQTIGYLYYDYPTCPGTSTFETVFQNSATLTAGSELYIAYQKTADVNPACNVNMTGSGTLKVGGNMYIGGRSWPGGGSPSASLNLVGITFLANNLNNLYVAENDHDLTVNGVLDLSQAAGIQSGSNPDCLIVNNNLWIGYRQASGQLKLPPTVTNITCGNLAMGCITSGNGFPYSVLDLGTNPALSRLTVAGNVTISKAYITYNDGSSQKTGFPPNVAVKIGSSGTPASLKLAYVHAMTADVVWSGFRRFEAWLNQLYIGVDDDGAGGGATHAELDLANSNTIDVTGSINTGMMSVADVRIGGNVGLGTGILRLPSSITNITVGILRLGQCSQTESDYSIIDLGSNSALRVLIISNEFRLGRGLFQYVNGGGNTVTGTPVGLKVQVGSPASRAGVFNVGDSGRYMTDSRFGIGVADFAAYVTDVTIGKPTAYNGDPMMAYLELRDTSNLVFDIQGSFDLNPKADSAYAFLFCGPTVGRVAASNLWIGRNGNVAHMVISNTQFSVSNEVLFGAKGKFTNYVNGVASGIDLQSTNITFNASSSGMHLVFQSDPPNQILPYWGLRLKGDAIDQIMALTTTPAKVTFDISSLSTKYKAKFGVFYDARTDKTILGIPSMIQGTVFVIH